MVDYGYFGMLLAAFLAGSAFPFSSEAVMVGLMAAGLDPWLLVVYASVGNTLGSYFNYALGYMGRIDWIERWLHVKPEKIRRTQQFMQGRGAWMGLLSPVPFLGTAVTIVLGLMHANIPITFLSIAISKVARYAVIAWAMVNV